MTTKMCIMVNNGDGKIIMRGAKNALIEKAKTMCASNINSYTIYEECYTVCSRLTVSVTGSED